MEHGKGVLIRTHQIFRGVAELFPDAFQFIRAAGRAHLTAGDLFLQIVNLCQIPDIGDNHGNIVFFIKDRGTGDQCLLAGLELLMQSNRVALLNGQKRTGHGNNVLFHQIPHITAYDFRTLQPGDQLIGLVDLDRICITIRNINSIKRVLDDRIQLVIGLLQIMKNIQRSRFVVI